jgi:hypothetical protein
VALAALVRLCNLGTFSFGLDEGLTMVRAVQPFPDMIAACAADADNPPLYLVITYCSLRLGLVDPWLRLVPVAAGLLSIFVWSWWTRRHFGDTASLLCAGFLALSTFHVRYSQELRAYPYLILLTGLAMLAGDGLRRRPGALSAAALAVAVTLGWYLHFSFAFALAPLVGLVLFGTEQGVAPAPAHRRTTVTWLVVALVVGTALFLPWFLHVRETLTGGLSRGANDWRLELVTQRWQFFTVAAFEGEDLDWLGLVLAALAVAGVLVAMRHRIGPAVLLSSVAGVLVGETFLVAVNRWSQGRYNAAVWPLLAIFIVLGLERLLAALRWRRLRAATLAALALLMLVKVDAYHRLGRPHWDRIATAVMEVRRSGEPVLAHSNWSQVTLEHYLGHPVRSLRHSVAELQAQIARSPSTLVVVQGGGPVPRLARRGVLIARVPRTGELYRLRPDSLDAGRAPIPGGWPAPSAALVSAELEQPSGGCLARRLGWPAPADPAGRPWSRLELDRSAEPFLRSGWSQPIVAGEGQPYRLVTGLEAAVVVQRPAAGGARISLRAASLRRLDRQEMRLLVNGCDLGTTALEHGPQIAVFDAPADCWRPGRNLLVLQFRQALDPDNDRGLPRAAAVDWIEITPMASSRAERASAARPALIQDVGER